MGLPTQEGMILLCLYSKRTKGFTLIEAIIVIAVISILAALIIPMIFNTTTQEKYKEAKAELEAIYNAIFGDGITTFGYHGDMGCIPYKLGDLFIQGDQPDPYEYPSGSGVIVGWKGPYISPRRVQGNDIIDPWGNPYSVVFTDIGGGFFEWQLVCAGMDGDVTTTNDNLYYPEEPVKVFHWGSVNTSLQDIYSVVNQVFFGSKVGKIENFPYTRYVAYYPVRGQRIETSGVPSSYYATDYNGKILNYVTAGKRAFQGAVYSGGSDRLGRYYVYTVPYAGQIHIYMDLTTDLHNSLIESLYEITGIQCRPPVGQKRICIRSSLNYNPTGPYSENGVELLLVGLGKLEWNSARRWYEIYLTDPPFDSSQTYSFTISSNGGASIVVNK